MNADCRVVSFGSGEAVPGKDLALLHMELLPHSPVVALGKVFMESFYYGILPLGRSIFGAVAYVDDCPAGFIVATEDSDGFMSEAIRNHWIKLSWIMTKSVFVNPTTLAGISETLSIMWHRRKATPVDPVGELLSFGVRPEFRSPAFVRQTGVRIGKDLMAKAMNKLGLRGVESVLSLVDKDNVEVKLLYRALGWELRNEQAIGWRTPQVEFIKHLNPQPDDQITTNGSQ